ncbi:MAG TPA: recombination mediator RecR [Halothiobacillus sp.]|nr:recombination mediator RecR [Halothiobacillus sp.]
MMISPKFTELVRALRCLPSVGAKTAQRMALQLIERDRLGAQHLADMIVQALGSIGRCQQCQALSETPMCTICADQTRNKSQLCIVESLTDWMAIEQSGAFQGYYFLLSGRLSPLDGIGPQEIGIEQLRLRLEDPAIEEVILATSATIEGEATANYLMTMMKNDQYRVTRLAQGVPMGGELEYLDGHTLALAMKSRRPITEG